MHAPHAIVSGSGLGAYVCNRLIGWWLQNKKLQSTEKLVAAAAVVVAMVVRRMEGMANLSRGATECRRTSRLDYTHHVISVCKRNRNGGACLGTAVPIAEIHGSLVKRIFVSSTSGRQHGQGAMSVLRRWEKNWGSEGSDGLYEIERLLGEWLAT